MKDILNVIPAQEGVRAIKQDEGKPWWSGYTQLPKPVHIERYSTVVPPQVC